MGRKIPMWQCILVMIVMVALIFWGVMIDTDAGEALTPDGEITLGEDVPVVPHLRHQRIVAVKKPDGRFLCLPGRAAEQSQKGKEGQTQRKTSLHGDPQRQMCLR